MMPVAEMSQLEIAAYVQSWLEQKGIHVVLSGGAATAYYSLNRYVSGDIDLVNIYSVRYAVIRAAMSEIGFVEMRRYFRHPEFNFIVEFPPGPLTVGIEPVGKVEQVELPSGTLRVISATDCVKDRLAAYYHWHDEQCLYQAALVRGAADVDMREVERWSRGERKEMEFQVFRDYQL